MAHFGLTGYPLGHSRSAELFAGWGYRYENYPIERMDAEAFAALLDSNPELTGLNVTAPHKTVVATLVNELDALAAETGAVNTVRIERDSDGKVLRTKGFNTDVLGFDMAVAPLIEGKEPGALVLGTGGASHAACAALRRRGVDVIVVSRTPSQGMISYSDIDSDLLSSHPLIVNATPLGTFPNIDSCVPLPYHLITERNACFDMVYNPPQTEFMRRSAARGATVANGFEMLRQQALAALKIWTT